MNPLVPGVATLPFSGKPDIATERINALEAAHVDPVALQQNNPFFQRLNALQSVSPWPSLAGPPRMNTHPALPTGNRNSVMPARREAVQNVISGVGAKVGDWWSRMRSRFA